jgi:hypothetical protein
MAVTRTTKMTMNPSSGKGDRYRKVNDRAYNENWERIYGNKKDKKKNAQDLPQNTESFGQEKI